MEQRFSDDFLKVLEFSRDEALRTGWHNICPDHIMLGILRHADNGATRVIEALGLIPDQLKVSLDEALFVSEQIPWEERESVNFSDSSLSLLQHAALEAYRCGSPETGAIHFLLAVIRVSGTYSHDYFDEHDISLRSAVEASGTDWKHYGVVRPSEAEGPGISSAQGLIQALEERIRQGFSPDGPAS